MSPFETRVLELLERCAVALEVGNEEARQHRETVLHLDAKQREMVTGYIDSIKPVIDNANQAVKGAEYVGSPIPPKKVPS